jgi:hypothetical protein
VLKIIILGKTEYIEAIWYDSQNVHSLSRLLSNFIHPSKDIRVFIKPELRWFVKKENIPEVPISPHEITVRNILSS